MGGPQRRASSGAPTGAAHGSGPPAATSPRWARARASCATRSPRSAAWPPTAFSASWIAPRRSRPPSAAICRPSRSILRRRAARGGSPAWRSWRSTGGVGTAGSTSRSPTLLRSRGGPLLPAGGPGAGAVDRKTRAVLDDLVGREAPARGSLSDGRSAQLCAAISDAWVDGRIPGFPEDEARSTRLSAGCCAWTSSRPPSTADSSRRRGSASCPARSTRGRRRRQGARRRLRGPRRRGPAAR